MFGQRTLRGTIIDAATGDALSFVNVFLEKDQSYGVLTNERGEYEITISPDQLDDRLVFSLLSYKTSYADLQELKEGQTVLNLQLSTTFLKLGEITVVSDLGLRQLVRKVLAHIPQNYGSNNSLLRGYVRKYSIDDDAYSQVIEAMVDIRDRAYTDPKAAHTPKAWLAQYRTSDYQGDAREDMRIYNHGKQTLLGGYLNPFSNAIRYHSIHWLELIDSSLNSMTFANRGEYVANGDTLVKLQYSLSESADVGNANRNTYSSYFSGELLINRSDLAVIRNTQGSIDREWYRDAVYRKTNGKYYPEKISSHITYNYNSGTRKSFQASLLYVTEVITGKQAVRKANKGNKGKLLVLDGKISTVKANYDPAFWEGNQILKLLPAPEALATSLNQLRSLEEQYRDNARRVKE